VRVLEAVARLRNIPLELTTKPFGGAAIDLTGDPLPADTLQSCQETDAVLMGTPAVSP
jgi:3-isopropylmalate dehydrogenase